MTDVPKRPVVRITNVSSDVEYDAYFGTLDCCYSSGSLHKTFFELTIGEGENSTTKTIENGLWSYGDYIDGADYVNVINFINSFNINNFEVDHPDEVDFNWFVSCSYEFDEDDWMDKEKP